MDNAISTNGQQNRNTESSGSGGQGLISQLANADPTARLFFPQTSHAPSYGSTVGDTYGNPIQSDSQQSGEQSQQVVQEPAQEPNPMSPERSNPTLLTSFRNQSVVLNRAVNKVLIVNHPTNECFMLKWKTFSKF